MTYQIIRPLESSEDIAAYYEIISNVIGGNIDDDQLWLVKQNGWIAAVAYDGFFYSSENEARFAKLLSDNDYQEFIAISWSKSGMTPPVYTIPATVEGIEDFRCNYYHWYVFFAGKPDWFILLANTLDFIIVGGLPDFVRQFLGCEPDEALKEIQEMAKSENLDLTMRRYYIYLIEQLQITYNQSKPGTIIQLGLPDSDDTIP